MRKKRLHHHLDSCLHFLPSGAQLKRIKFCLIGTTQVRELKMQQNSPKVGWCTNWFFLSPHKFILSPKHSASWILKGWRFSRTPFSLPPTFVPVIISSWGTFQPHIPFPHGRVDHEGVPNHGGKWCTFWKVLIGLLCLIIHNKTLILDEQLKTKYIQWRNITTWREIRLQRIQFLCDIADKWRPLSTLLSMLTTKHPHFTPKRQTDSVELPSRWPETWHTSFYLKTETVAMRLPYCLTNISEYLYTQL